MFIAVDANPDALLEVAWKAERKPARGGVRNLLCIGEPLDVVATELGPVADQVTVILPWASLLRAVALPEIPSLYQIRSLCGQAATIEVVLSYDPTRDAIETGPLGSTTLDAEHFLELPSLYAQAGLNVISIDRISPKELAAYETTWSGRLAFGREREVWRLRARA